jgi:hypothetical protein
MKEVAEVQITARHIKVYVRSRRAGKRIMASVSRFPATRLKVNVAKR